MGIKEPSSIAARRRKLAEIRGEPITTETRTVINIDGALYVNIPDNATDFLDFNEGDTATVHCYDDRIETRPHTPQQTPDASDPGGDTNA